MKRASVILVLVSLLTITMISASSCGEKIAQLPEYKIGDQWVYKMESKGLIYEVNINVTEIDTVGGKESYVTVWEYQPALEGVITNMSAWIGKATMLPTRAQMTGQMMGLPYSVIVDFSYFFPDQEWWPLEVGKEIEVDETLSKTTKALGLENKETERKTSTYEVVRIEDITVLAGTFKCFKIVEYDKTGKKISATWYSDDVKNDVKYIDYEAQESLELKSYSL